MIFSAQLNPNYVQRNPTIYRTLKGRTEDLASWIGDYLPYRNLILDTFGDRASHVVLAVLAPCYCSGTAGSGAPPTEIEPTGLRADGF
jgi:hypothetical protein